MERGCRRAPISHMRGERKWRPPTSSYATFPRFRFGSERGRSETVALAAVSRENAAVEGFGVHPRRNVELISER